MVFPFPLFLVARTKGSSEVSWPSRICTVDNNKTLEKPAGRPCFHVLITSKARFHCHCPDERYVRGKAQDLQHPMEHNV